MEKNNLKYKKYSPLDVFRFYLLALLFTQLAAFVAMVVLSNSAAQSGISLNAMLDRKWVGVSLSLVYPLVITALFFIYNSNYRFNTKKAINFKWQFNWQKVALVLLLSVVCLFLLSPFINMLEHLYSLFGYSPDGSMPFEILTVADLLLGIVLLAFIPAVVEEIVFRGVFLQGLLNRFNKTTAVVVSAVLFMLFHLSLQQTAFQLVLGVILAYLAINNGLIYAMLMHFFNNAIVLIAYYIKPSEASPAVSITDGILAVVLLVVGVALIVWILRTLKNLKQSKIAAEGVAEDAVASEQSAVEQEQTPVEKGRKGGFLKALTQKERLFFWLTIVFSSILWLINTMGDIV